MYVHIQNAKAFAGMKLPSVPQRIDRCSLLDGTPIRFEQDESGVAIHVPEDRWEPFDTAVKVEFEAN